jgi:hypothetical protein
MRSAQTGLRGGQNGAKKLQKQAIRLCDEKIQLSAFVAPIEACNRRIAELLAMPSTQPPSSSMPDRPSLTDCDLTATSANAGDRRHAGDMLDLSTKGWFPLPLPVLLKCFISLSPLWHYCNSAGLGKRLREIIFCVMASGRNEIAGANADFHRG